MTNKYTPLKGLLYKNGIKQTDLAKKMNRSQLYVNKRLNGEYSWTMDDCVFLAKLLNIQENEFIKYFAR